MNNLNNNTNSWSSHFFNQLENDLKELQNEKTELSNEASPRDFSTAQGFLLSDLDQKVFQEKLTAYNKKVSAFAQEVLKNSLSELKTEDNMCLLTTGSDGRQEKLCLSASPMELMLVFNKKTAANDSLIEKVKGVVAQYPKLFYPSLEVKYLEEGKLMYRHSTPYPTRALDALYLAGSEKTLANYQEQFFQELRNENSTKPLDKFSKGPRRDAFLLLQKTLDNKSTVHLDMEKGLLKYNTLNEENKIQATKYPLLRTVQYGVAWKICKLVSQGKLEWDAFSKLPTSTFERVHWLAKHKLLKRNVSELEVEELKKAYTVALVWQEAAQRAYEKEDKECLQVSQQDLYKVATTINKLKDEFMS